MHTGEQAQARELARANLRLFPRDVVPYATAGCGSGMEYRWRAIATSRSRAFAEKARDVSVYLHDWSVAPPPLALPVARPTTTPAISPMRSGNGRAACPAGCRGQPHDPEILEGELCCGSAGTYNMEQPEIAERLGDPQGGQYPEHGGAGRNHRQHRRLTQIRSRLAAQGRPLPVWHTMEVLDRAYRRRGPVGEESTGRNS